MRWILFEIVVFSFFKKGRLLLIKFCLELFVDVIVGNPPYVVDLFAGYGGIYLGLVEWYYCFLCI